MKRERKSEWVSVSLETERHVSTVRGWFSPFCDDMTPVRAELLIDRDTDAEKKVRVLMVRKGGTVTQAVRARTKSGWTVTLKPVQP